MEASKYLPMIEQLQCPGCVCGSDTKCGNFKLTEHTPGSASCDGHVPGTTMMPGGKILLGMPTGFNKIRDNKLTIRFFPHGEKPSYDHLNVPVWAMEYEGSLFIRVYCPRITTSYLDVVEKGTRAEFCPQALDVAEFVDTID